MIGKNICNMQLENKKILVTGGAGAIGSRLVNRLFEYKPSEVVVVDDLSSGFLENIDESKVNFVRGSVADDATLAKAFENGINIVFHMAAHFANQNSVDHPEKDLQTNGFGTLKILQKCIEKKVDKFVYASSSCVYGNAEGALKESNNPGNLDTPYAISKLLGEHYTKFFHDHHGLNTVVLRYFNSYGPAERPGQYRNVIPNFVALAKSGKPLIITGDGSETRDFTYIEDTVEGTILAASSDKSKGKIYNIGSGQEVTIKELAETINKLTNNQANIEYKDRRSWDHISRRLADIDQAKEDFDYNPSHDLESNLKKTIKWFEENNIK